MNLLKRIWVEDDGVLTLEFCLLTTMMCVGVVGGMAASRDALITELADVATAITHLDQSYEILPPLAISVHDGLSSGAVGSVYADSESPVEIFRDLNDTDRLLIN
jgi:Flp pilus assembly pilin Flp